MGSIASTLNSIDSSLLSQIANYSTQSQTSSNTSASTSATASDTVDFSQVAQLFKDLGQLETTNPAEFQQIAADAASQLQAAASQTDNPQQAAFLNNLAQKFQTASTTGNLSAFQSGSTANSTNGLYTAHGHHHHHGGGGAPSTTQSTVTATSQTT